MIEEWQQARPNKPRGYTLLGKVQFRKTWHMEGGTVEVYKRKKSVLLKWVTGRQGNNDGHSFIVELGRSKAKELIQLLNEGVKVKQ